MQTFILNNNKLKAHFINYGATLTHLFIRDAQGVERDVVLGFDDPKDYIKVGVEQNPFLGCIVGRSCNRTKEGKMQLNGKPIELPINNGPNSLHGGIKGFDKQYWNVQEYAPENNKLLLSYISKSGEEGFPGEIKVTVSFELEDFELCIDYKTEWTDSKDNQDFEETVVNLTNHSYFNLSGLSCKTVENCMCSMSRNVQGHLELDSTQIPTGVLVKNEEGPPEMDFVTSSTLEKRGPKTFGQGLPLVTEFRGYDHFFVLSQHGPQPILAAKVHSLDTGISVELHTNSFGFQLYTGNWLDGTCRGKQTQKYGYGQYSGFCLEASAPPDSVNHESWRSLVVLKKGQTVSKRDVYRFSLV